MYEVNSIEELNARYMGVSEIIKTWFVNYKGPGKLSSKGYVDKNEAEKILKYAITAFEEGR